MWERGDIGLDQLSKQLKCITQHALCDLLMEYLLLPAPLSSIPLEYQLDISYRLRSLSEPPTPSSISPSSKALRPDTPKLDLEKNTAQKGSGSQEISSGNPPLPIRKISSDSIKSAPGHRRTPSSESQGKEFKTFIERQGFKGHRRSKSTEIRGKTYIIHHRTNTYDGKEKTYSPIRSSSVCPSGDATTSSRELVPLEVNTAKPKRKLGYPGKAMSGNEDIAKDKRTAPIDIIAKADTKEDFRAAASLEIASEAQEIGNGDTNGNKADQALQAKEDGLLVPIQSMENYFSEPSRDTSSRDSPSLDVTPECTETAMRREDSSVELVSTFETLSHQEILESQEYASSPVTPSLEEKKIQVPVKKTDKTSPESSRPSSSEVKHREGDAPTFSPISRSANITPLLTPTLKDGHETWQDLERRRRTLQERLKKRMQYEDGEKGELHPK